MEILDIVDEDDLVVGSCARSEVHEKQLRSRNVAIFMKDENEKYLVMKRSAHKRYHPNLFDCAACGSVQQGESYEDAAKREVLEELGISCALTFAKKIINDFDGMKFITSIFVGSFSGDILPNDEHEEYARLSADELQAFVENESHRCTQGFVNDVKSLQTLKNRS